jgi:predicted SprT family Zn-dependent metalloprotease
MDIRKAEIMALTLIEKHLSDAKFDWQFEFNNAKRTFGQCVYGKKYGRPFHMIKLSKPLVALNDEEQVRDTILHEIAHALDVEQRGYSSHDYKWVSIARSIGCNGNRCYNVNDVEQPKSKYSLICNSCKREVPAYRKPKRKKACGVCCRKYNNSKYSEDYLLNLKQNY